MEQVLTVCIAGKSEMIARNKGIQSRYRGLYASWDNNMTEAFKVVKFPGCIGEVGSDLQRRRLLAKQ